MRVAWIFLVPLMLGVSTPAHAQKRTMEQPRVTMEAARRAALAHVPHSTVIKSELDHQKGKPVYEFDLRVAGRSGYDEVKVDGMTGHVMSTKHESGEMKGEAPRVTMEAARRTALAHVPHSAVIKEELDHENGKPVYEFNLKVAGTAGYEEVKVDGMTGQVMSTKHESVRQEAKKVRKETKKAAKPASH